MPDAFDPRADDPDRRPLDDFFVGGARYHEPTAAEREVAAKRAAKEREKQQKERLKEIARTRRVLEGREHSTPSNPFRGSSRDTWIAFVGLVAVSLLLSFTPFAG